MAKIQKNEFYIAGKVISVSGVQTIETKIGTITKQIVVLEVFADARRQEVPFEIINKPLEFLSDIKAGDWVGIDFLLKGRYHTPAGGKTTWYVSLDVLSINREN